MLDRVSAALAKFLSPLTGSINNSLDSDSRNKEGFQRFKKKSTKEETKSIPPIKLGSLLSLVPNPGSSPENDPKNEIKKETGIASSLIGIFAHFQEHRMQMRRWGGKKTYDNSLRSKSMTQLRKGTIFDEKAN